MIKKIAMISLGIVYSCAVSYAPTLIIPWMWLKVVVFIFAQFLIWVLLGDFFINRADYNCDNCPMNEELKGAEKK